MRSRAGTICAGAWKPIAAATRSFIPALPDEPIIFIEAALTHGMSEKVQPLLDPDSPVLPPDSADCAMFYSITNCQEGLRGVPFGSFLIKQVVEDLGREFPRIRKFATVSPVPRFREWLAANPELAALRAKLDQHLDQPRWWENKELSEELRAGIGSLCARYLLQAKHGPRAARSGGALSSPQRSAAGAHQLARRYLRRGDAALRGHDGELLLPAPDLERNHEDYTRDYEIVATSEIESLAKRKAPRPATRSDNKRLPA